MSSHESFDDKNIPREDPRPLGPLEFALHTFRNGQEHAPKPIKEQWREKRYAEVPNTVTKESAESVVALFRDFCSLPDEIKNSIHIPGPKGRGAGSYGYVERTPDTDPEELALGKVPEHKVYFHYRPFIETDLAQQIETAGSKGQNFIAALREMWLHIEERAFETVQRMYQENAGNPAYANFVERFFPDGITAGNPNLKGPRLKLRLMMYKKVEGKNVLSANNHYDAGGLTFAVCESSPGLQVGSRAIVDDEGRVICSEHMEEVERPNGTALVWPSSTFSCIDPEVEATWHGVKQHTHGAIQIGEENRWVVVAFLNEQDGFIPSLEVTHGLKALTPSDR